MDTKNPDGQDGYVLARNHAATSRLNYQYYVWQHACGFHLHPSIPQLAADAQVVDVATGSGIWLLDLSEKLPATISLDGLDISLTQCPPKAWLPSNVNFRKWDFFSDVPPDLVGRYDVVHIRLVAVTIKNNDPTNLIKNLARLLKSGGYLQWDELDTPTAHVFSAEPDQETTAIAQLRDLLQSSMKGRHGEVLLGSRDWIQEIPATLTANGFQDARKYQYLEAPHMAGFWNDVWVLSAEEFVDVMLKTGDQEKEKSLRDMVLTASRQSSSGAAVRYTKMSVVARRED